MCGRTAARGFRSVPSPSRAFRITRRPQSRVPCASGRARCVPASSPCPVGRQVARRHRRGRGVCRRVHDRMRDLARARDSDADLIRSLHQSHHRAARHQHQHGRQSSQQHGTAAGCPGHDGAGATRQDGGAYLADVGDNPPPFTTCKRLVANPATIRRLHP